MASWKQQALIDAPVERLWDVLSDPATYPHWASDSVEVTGLPTKIEKGATFELTGPGPLGRTTTYKIEELDDLRQIKLRCQSSGYYAHWVLTKAQEQTFADVEIGVEPIGVNGRMMQAALPKRKLRQIVNQNLDGLRRVLSSG
jgi:Polyketide cyclase / dehydrase and lipid transport